MVFSDREKKVFIAIQNDSRITGKELAARSGHTTPGVSRLIRKLKTEGFIKRYTVEIDHGKFGFQCLAFMRIKLRNQDEQSTSALSEILYKNDNILEIHKVFGEWDFIVKIRTKENKDIQRLAEFISGHQQLVENVKSEIVSETLLEEISVPAPTLVGLNNNE